MNKSLSCRWAAMVSAVAAMIAGAAFAASVPEVALTDFDWSTQKATVSNMTKRIEYMRLVCSWHLTIDDDVWSEGSVDLYQLPPGACASFKVPFRRLPPTFAPASYGVKRLALRLVDDGARFLAARTFEMPGKPQLFPPTPERFSFKGPILSKPYLQCADTNGVTVCLETRLKMPGLRLKWRREGEKPFRQTPFAFTRAVFSGTFLAKARIEGLEPGTKVAYEVAGEKGTFTAWRDSADDFKCAVFGDFQSGLSNGPKWWDWEQDPFLCGERMFADMVESGCDFAVGTGDLADTADYRKEIRPLILDRMCGVMGSKIPFFIAFGNHDTIHPASHFFMVNPVSDPRLSSFAFFRNKCLFVCIDDAEVGNDKIPGRPEVREWFERLMSTQEAREAKFRFVFQHVPVYVESNGNCDRWLADLYEKYGVDCIFSGDHHGYERIVRGRTRQVVNGCMGYFDHGDPEASDIVNWYGDETKAGGHRGMPRPVRWRFQKPGEPGVLGPETPVYEGLLPGYATLEVKGDTATWTLIGFNADGSKIGPVDSFTMKSGVRPDAPKGLALERYCYRQSPKGKWLMKYTLTGADGRVETWCEDDSVKSSRPIIEKDRVGIAYTDLDGREHIIMTGRGETPRPRASSPVYINSDAWNFWLDPKVGRMSRDELRKAVEADVDFYAVKGVKGVFYNMNFQRCFFPTKVGTPYWKDISFGADGRMLLRGRPITYSEGERASRDPDAEYRTMYDGVTNMVARFPEFMTYRYEYCHRKGIEMWHSFRVDDIHHTPLGLEWRPQHGDLWLDSKDCIRAWYRHTWRGEWADNALDYGNDRVYAYHLGIVREYLMNTPSDGLEFDWLRAAPVFRPGFDDFNRDRLTRFVRDARRIADEAERKWGHRIRFAHRVPARVRDAQGLGMDIAGWAREGLLDVLIPDGCPGTETEQDADVALYRALAPKPVVLAPEIDCTVFARWGYVLGIDSPSYDRRFDTGFASSFYQQGADGIYFYNHFPRHGKTHPWIPAGFSAASDRAAVAALPRRHPATYHVHCGESRSDESPFPEAIWAKCCNGGVNICCGEGNSNRTARVVLGSTVPLEVDVLVNTVRCAAARPVGDTSHLPKGPSYRAFEIPPGVLHDGINNVEIFNRGAETITRDHLVWMEVEVDGI